MRKLRHITSELCHQGPVAFGSGLAIPLTRLSSAVRCPRVLLPSSLPFTYGWKETEERRQEAGISASWAVFLVGKTVLPLCSAPQPVSLASPPNLVNLPLIPTPPLVSELFLHLHSIVCVEYFKWFRFPAGSNWYTVSRPQFLP